MRSVDNARAAGGLWGVRRGGGKYNAMSGRQRGAFVVCNAADDSAGRSLCVMPRTIARGAACAMLPQNDPSGSGRRMRAAV